VLLAYIIQGCVGGDPVIAALGNAVRLLPSKPCRVMPPEWSGKGLGCRPPGPGRRDDHRVSSRGRRYDQSEYEPFWAAAAALDMPLSLHTATRRQGKIRGAGPGTLRDASSRATKAFCPAPSMCDMIFSGVFERHPRLTLAIVEFELAWAPHLLSTMDYTYRERHGEAIYRFKTACFRAISSAARSC
jgi:predicted TIM-barrel fold metal-dependent hydrolase